MEGIIAQSGPEEGAQEGLILALSSLPRIEATRLLCFAELDNDLLDRHARRIGTNAAISAASILKDLVAKGDMRTLRNVFNALR